MHLVLPEFGESTSIESYKPILLYSQANSSAGTIPDALGNATQHQIGFARVRNIDEQSSSLLNLYLFDH